MLRKITGGFRDAFSGIFFGISPRHIKTSKVQCLSEIQQVKKGHSTIPKNGFFGNHYVMVQSCLSSFGAKSSILTVFPSFAFVLPTARHLPARSRGLEDGSLRFLLFPSFPSLLSLISLLLALYSSLLFSSLLFSSLLFSSLFSFFF